MEDTVRRSVSHRMSTLRTSKMQKEDKKSVHTMRSLPQASCLAQYVKSSSPRTELVKKTMNFEQMKVAHEDKRSERKRLKTFKSCPLSLKYLAEQLAISGFYFLEKCAEDDKVKCVYCQGSISNWKWTDSPRKRHKQQYPLCPFILNFNVGNRSNAKRKKSKISSKDPDFTVPTTYPSMNVISRQCMDIDASINEFDLDWRKSTFNHLPALEQWSYHGLFIKYINESKFIKCCICWREVEILEGIEELSWQCMHKNNCSYIEEEVINHHYNDALVVEYTIMEEEVEMRVDVLTSKTTIKTDASLSRQVIKRHLRNTGEDYPSTYNLLLDLRRPQELSVPENENSKLTSFVLRGMKCAVCLEEPVCVIFLPCGHFKTCDNCSERLSNCPICRMLIAKRVSGIKFQ